MLKNFTMDTAKRYFDFNLGEIFYKCFCRILFQQIRIKQKSKSLLKYVDQLSRRCLEAFSRQESETPVYPQIAIHIAQRSG